MEQNMVEVSGWWALLPIAIVLFGIWLYKTIKIYRDPEFKFSQQSGIPYRLVKEYEKAWYEIKASNKQSGKYDEDKAMEILSKLSDISGWVLYSRWKLEQSNRELSKKLQSSDWWQQDLD